MQENKTIKTKNKQNEDTKTRKQKEEKRHLLKKKKYINIDAKKNDKIGCLFSDMIYLLFILVYHAEK